MQVNQANKQHRGTGLRAALFTVLLVIFVGFSLIAFQDNQMILSDLNQNFQIAFFSALTILLIFATLSSMISSTYVEDEFKISDHSFLISALSLFAALGELVNYNRQLDPNFYYAGALVLNTAICFNVSRISVSLLRISGKWPNYIALGNASIVLATGMLMSEDLRLGGYSESLLNLGILTHSILAFLPISLIILTYANLGLRLDPNDFSASLRERFNPKNASQNHIISFFAITFIELALALVSIVMLFDHTQRSEDLTNLLPHYPMSQIHLAWIPLSILTIKMLKEAVLLTEKNSSISSLVSNHAKRLLQRQQNSKDKWSTIIGMCSVNYMIDHDPSEETKSTLPAYMVRIRNDQIQSIARDLLGPKLLDERSVSNQLFGTLDPENSQRPCVDTLLCFTTMYMDGILLVENRLKNLVRLFPILDPELSRAITAEKIEAQLGKIRWFFHIDYDWVDQHLVASESRTQYQVSIDSLRLRDRQRILDYLEKQNLIGNFISISDRARERLIMEAPYLSSIIEAWPVEISQAEGNSVHSVIFLIKFESLIPRMQKYYNLDDFRQKLRHHEASAESKRMLSIIELEIEQSKNSRNILDILALTNNYPWRGFKEKDLALELVLMAFEKLESIDTKLSGQLLAKFVEAIQNIGYPSQAIHAAHQEKMEIRNAYAISEACLNPSSPRFSEAWLLIASTPAQNYFQDELLMMLGTIDKAITDKQIRRKPIVCQKAAEAFFNISQHLDYPNTEYIHLIANKLINYLIDIAADAEQFCFFIDAKIFLESNIKENIVLSHETIIRLQEYFSHLYEVLGSNSAKVMSLSGRWRTLVHQSKQQAS